MSRAANNTPSWCHVLSTVCDASVVAATGHAIAEDEVTALLEGARKLQLATINPDGTPHLVTMFYGLDKGRITFWTYGKAQKARNLARDPRVSCLIEAGEDYAELRGVELVGTGEIVSDLNQISVAVGHAAVAATAIHRSLPYNFR